MKSVERYVKLSTHDRAMAAAYRDYQKRLDNDTASREKRAEARGYERGLNEAWRDAMALLRKNGIINANATVKEMASKGNKARFRP